MAITTYAELKTAVADFLNRDDLGTTTETFIALCEAQVSRDLRHWRMEERSTGQQSGGDQFMKLPADWVETIRLTVTGTKPVAVNLLSRDAMADLRQESADTANTPCYYAHVRGELELYPTPSADTDLELLYYAKVPALSDSNTSNWLLTEAPDVYLYGSLVHSAPYLADDARVMVWASMYQSALDKLNLTSEKARYSGSGLKIKIRGLS